MKYLKLMLLLVIMIYISGCSKVDQGYEAAKINTIGSGKGTIQILKEGRHWYNPYKYDLKHNPLYFQEYVWKKTEYEDNSITFQSANSLKFTADVGAKIALKPGMSGELWKAYHKTADDIIETNFANTLQDAFNRKASERAEENIYGPGKTEFVTDVTKDLQKSWEKFFIIERVYLIGSLDPPPSIKRSIDAKIQATQKAQQRRNEVEQSKAEADKKIEVARGNAESQNLATDAAVYAINQKAKAEAGAMKLKNKQLTKSPAYIEYIKATRWDGKLPTYMAGSAVPMLNVK